MKLLSNAKQDREDLQRAKQDLENLLEHLRQEKRNMVRSRAEPGITSSRVEVTRVLVVFLSPPPPPHHQVNQQQQEAQQLNQDLVQQKAELMALRSSLENKEKVRLIRHLLSDRLLGFTHPRCCCS